MKREFSAGGVIIRKIGANIQALVIKDSFENFSFPKGHIQDGESIEEAAKREVQEEVGIKNLKLIAEIGTNEYYFIDRFNNNEKIHKQVHYFLFKTTPDEKVIPQKDEGISDPSWVELENLLSKISYDNLKPIALTAIKKAKEVND